MQRKVCKFLSKNSWWTLKCSIDRPKSICRIAKTHFWSQVRLSSRTDSIKLRFCSGLKLQGASCRNNALLFSNSIIDDIPVMAVQWILPKDSKNSSDFEDELVNLPVYGNALRTELLCTVNVRSGQKNSSEFHFYERGVAVLASSLE